MKTLLAFAVLSMTGVAHADSTILSCSTSGDALGSLVIKSSGVVEIVVGEDDSAPVPYRISIGLKDVQAGSSATVIADAAGSQPFGGATNKSILLRILDGQKTAYLGMGGSVFKLSCHK